MSARQLRLPDLVVQVRQALDASGLPPAALEQELTESAPNDEHLDQFVEVLRGLKALGV